MVTLLNPSKVAEPLACNALETFPAAVTCLPVNVKA
jgi:hypothetical protein